MESNTHPRLVGEVTAEATQRLASAGLESPREEARILLASTLDKPMAWVMAHPEAAISPDSLDLFQSRLDRRARREPMAYILGREEFYGLDFIVNPDVLIPRPETEILVERAAASARQYLAVKGRDLVVADLGTGSGAIAIALATLVPRLRVLAVDRSPAALEMARMNADLHGVQERVVLVRGSLLEEIDGPLDLLVANLPYIPTGELDALMPEVGWYEPREALDGGDDGTAIIELALEQAANKMAIPSMLLFEIGDGQGERLKAAADGYFPDSSVHVERDYAGFERILSVQLVGWC